MKIIVTSNYAVIREGIVAIISKISKILSYEELEIMLVSETINEAMFMIKGNLADLVLIDINKDNEKELDLIGTIKNSGVSTKLVIFDFYGSNECFIKALKYGVHGYIFGKSDEEEILYAIDQIYKGKKYYDSYFVDSMINEKVEPKCKLDMLTVREKEILFEIAKGLSNRKISEKFFITEHTVKKHINHIFDKLNINDRTEAALYVNKFEIVSK
jgi:two-component system nitrate/nitrite response regulator NarL